MANDVANLLARSPAGQAIDPRERFAIRSLVSGITSIRTERGNAVSGHKDRPVANGYLSHDAELVEAIGETFELDWARKPGC
jgi:hypothetical protein